jgi:hypothetical protein
MSETNKEQMIEQFELIEAMVGAARGDLEKSLDGNRAAGGRFRKSGRELKKLLHKLVQDSVSYGKS